MDEQGGNVYRFGPDTKDDKNKGGNGNSGNKGSDMKPEGSDKANKDGGAQDVSSGSGSATGGGKPNTEHGQDPNGPSTNVGQDKGPEVKSPEQADAQKDMNIPTQG